MTESSRHRTERPKLLLELSLWVTAEVGGAGRLSCISLQQPHSQPWHLVLAASPDLLSLREGKTFILPVLRKDD